MPVRLPGLLLLILALCVTAGCSRGRPSPPPEPPKKEAPPPPPAPEPKAKPPEPKPEDNGKLTVPEPDKAKADPDPWAFGPAPEPAAAAPVSFPGLSPFAVTGIAVRPEANRAVVTIRNDKKGQQAGTRLVLCDTAAGKALTEWPLPGECAVLDFSPDRRSVLTTAPQGGRGRDVLRLWLIGSDDQLKKWTFPPHTIPEVPPRSTGGRPLTEAESVEVRWAAFVGNDRVVSMSRDGQLKVFDTDGPRLVAGLDATPCRPAVTPDGTRVAFLAGESVALLDPVARKVVGTRVIGPPPPHPVFAFSPDGKQLAVAGNGRVILLDLAAGTVRHVAVPKLRVNDNGTFDKPFGWAGDRYFYADQQLHDPAFPFPVWDYHGAEQAQFRGRQLWLSVRAPGTATSVLRPFTLPHADPQPHALAAQNKPDAFLFKPGNPVRIDLEGVPADRRDEVKAALEGRLKELGLVPDGNAPAVLFASVDPVGTVASVTYPGEGTLSYVKRPARLRLVLNSREAWSEAWSLPPPLTLEVPRGAKVTSVLAKTGAGEPNYDLFAKLPMPASVPGPNSPGGPFGTSDFTTDGLKDRGK